MTSRDRVLMTFRFEPTDRVPLDLMEGYVSRELVELWAGRLGLQDEASVCRYFAGKIAFHGGIDCQQLFTYWSEEDVRQEVRRNTDLFSKCGGYIVANAHEIENIRPENMVAMLEEAGAHRPARQPSV